MIAALSPSVDERRDGWRGFYDILRWSAAYVIDRSMLLDGTSAALSRQAANWLSVTITGTFHTR